MLFKNSFRFGSIFFGIVLIGCSSARMSDQESDRLFRSGHYEEATEHLKQGLKSQGESGRDLLLYLLDVGLSLHSAGHYEESVQVFLRADRIAEIKDYTSLAAETATLLTSENLKDYKGEDFENVLISAYLSMNYALMGKNEDALVEARRVNHKLELMVTQGKRKYKQSAFARYLSAILYEADRDYNNAYVDYKNTHDLDAHVPGLGSDLWRCALQLRMPDEMEHWDQEYHLTKEDHSDASTLGPRSSKAEIIVLYENGISPIKRPNPVFAHLPKFYPRHNPVSQASIEVNGKIVGTPFTLENIEATAIANLEEKYGALIAKKVAGVVAKESLSYAIGRESPILGMLTRFALYASDQADLRSWNLLPKDLQLLRIVVDPGTYRVRARPSGTTPLPEKVIQVGPGKKAFVNFRYMP
jgi:hypothetical protein